MATRRKTSEESETRTRRAPAKTPEQRENELINLAIDLTEKQMRNGTASSQQVTHFLKLGSSREKLEKERLAMENELAQAKMDQLKSQQRVEELYAEALVAFKAYQGHDELEVEYDD